jgi:hypothetical protein
MFYVEHRGTVAQEERLTLALREIRRENVAG